MPILQSSSPEKHVAMMEKIWQDMYSHLHYHFLMEKVVSLLAQESQALSKDTFKALLRGSIY